MKDAKNLQPYSVTTWQYEIQRGLPDGPGAATVGRLLLTVVLDAFALVLGWVMA
jgi:hypothetical protein